jgi:hypothetical protein
MKICVVSASLGGVDSVHDELHQHAPQSVEHDRFTFTDENFQPRDKSMLPRLQAKIPKMFAWQMHPGYDYYVWHDGSIVFRSPDALRFLVEECEGHDIVVFKHPVRPDIRQEYRYTRKGIKQKAKYMLSRFTGEFLQEQYDEILADKEFVDDSLYLGGIFIYKNTPQVQGMLKEWWYHVSRYLIQDQLAFPYVIQKSGIKVKKITHFLKDSQYFGFIRHSKNHQ